MVLLWGLVRWLIFTTVGRGILLAFTAAGIHPDQWIADMIAAAARKTEAAAAVRWLGCGLFGLLCLIGWEAGHIDERLAAVWPFQTERHLRSAERERLYTSFGKLASDNFTLPLGAPADIEAKRYAEEFSDVFRKTGIHLAGDRVLEINPQTSTSVGIYVLLNTSNVKSENGVAVHQALTNAGFTPHYEYESIYCDSQPEMMNTKQGCQQWFQLVIGQRPQ
jgi:hypothetical protein